MKRARPWILLVALAGSAVAGIGSAQQTPRARSTARAPAPPPAGHGSITADLPCSACHTPEGWSIQGSSAEGGFDHSRTGFPLAGRHRAVACVSCHQPGRRIGRDCVSCHQDQHQARLGQDCARCHSAIGWTDTRDLEIHRLTRLPLTGMHAIAACTDCHRRTEDRQYSAVPAECFACHEDEYRRPDTHPSHVDGAFSRNCQECHRTSGWSPAIVDPTALGRTSGGLTERAPARHELRFPITRGSHRGAACASCHEDRQIPTAVRCDGCHAHNPVQLRRQHRTVSAGTDGRGCLGCHPGGMTR